MECLSGNRVSLSGNGVSLWKWSVSLEMECPSGNKVSLWKWSVSLEMECPSLWELCEGKLEGGHLYRKL
jgi:hypothetical protein